VALHKGWGEHRLKAHALHEPSTFVVVPLAGHPLPVGGPGAHRLGGVAGAAHGIGVTEATEAVAGIHILCIGVVVGLLGVKRSPGEGAVLQDVDLVVRTLGATVSNLLGQQWQQAGGKQDSSRGCEAGVLASDSTAVLP
jgi:hypothetical protein